MTLTTTYIECNVNIENNAEIEYTLVADIALPARDYMRIDHDLVNKAVCVNERLAWPDRVMYDKDVDEFEFYGSDYRKHIAGDTLIYVQFNDYESEILKLKKKEKAVLILIRKYEPKEGAKTKL